ncbi:MAG: iron-sulfur cluster assembly protein [Planctomycetota bacterium]|nr:iron-sulfur cluster assembly protein [Planctomycetota bacterium]
MSQEEQEEKEIETGSRSDSPLESAAGEPSPIGETAASPSASPEQESAAAEMSAEENVEAGAELTEEQVREALKEVIDPELFVNIVDLGLIYTVNLREREGGKYDVDIEMTMTSPMCPAGPQLVGNSRNVVTALPQVEEVDVKVVMDPPWNQDMMSEDAKDKLNIF